MPEQDPSTGLPPSAKRMIREVASQQRRTERPDHRWSWSSITVLGVVGWSVTISTLLGLALGLWIDHHWPSRFPWSLVLLVVGLVFGCVTAWLRVKGDAE